MALMIIQTVALTATLSDWSAWEESPHPFDAKRHTGFVFRYRALTVGQAQLAKITEHARPNGVRQYIVTYTMGPSPWPKFDTYAQAHAHLDAVLEGLS